MDYNELAEKFPFLSCVKHGMSEYVGILQNQDDFVTSIYVYDDIPSEALRTEFLRLGDVWWWESNRAIPINIFLAGEFNPFQNWLKTFTTKDTKMIFGPSTSLNNIVRKRIKRRQIQLVKKTDR
mgnify:FL=1|jgi:hypothetical protein|tara:strand:+ start:59 stop:430 length:372 start_codon:yes stop_codon:yes gene_type:complete